MRKLFLSALLILAALSACQKNELSAPVTKGEVIYATIEDVASTRTVKDENNNIRWSEGDQIIAFMNSTLGVKYQVSSASVGETSASFEEVSTGGLNAGTELDHIVAYYPYSSSVKIARSGDNYTLNAVLPSEQIYASESFGNGAFPMIAVSSTNNLTFKNICGAMKLQLKGTQKVASIKVEGKNNERLSGAAGITAYADGNKPAITMSSDASTSVVLDCGSGVQLNETEATEFIVTLPPTLFTKGFVVTISDAAGNSSLIETDKSNEVRRSSVLVMPAVTLENGDLIPQEGDYVDEYGINHGQGVEIDGVVWAPVNCGYHATDYKYGKLYQWGRKYGQGYNGGLYDVNDNYLGEVSDALVPEIVAGAVSLEIGQSKTNENKFYYNSSVPLDWCSPQNDNLWNAGTEANPVKTEYDPCPDGWRIPTYAELERLRQSSFGWTNQNGQNGYVFREANPDIFEHANLFFSAAGYRGYQYNIAIDRGSGCYYWSSESDDGTSSFMTFYGTGHGTTSRYGGFSIRCVQDDNMLIPVSTIALDESTLSLKVNDKYTLSATITPTNANHQYAFWWSDDPSVATVDQDGNVSAVSFGNTIISAMAGMEVATCKVIVTVSSSESDLKDYVDEYGENHGPGIKIGETVWAPVNCGYHATDFKYGKLYQWGRKYGQGYLGTIWTLNGYKEGEYSDASIPLMEEGGVSVAIGCNYNNTNVFYIGVSDWAFPRDDKLWNSGSESNPIKTEYDPCPNGWRVPTWQEMDNLIQNKSSWITVDNQNGYWFSGGNSYTEKVPQIFLPAAGYRIYIDGEALFRGIHGNYWSSGLYYGHSHSIDFRSSGIYEGGNRASGMSVRCVQE